MKSGGPVSASCNQLAVSASSSAMTVDRSAWAVHATRPNLIAWQALAALLALGPLGTATAADDWAGVWRAT